MPQLHAQHVQIWLLVTPPLPVFSRLANAVTTLFFLCILFPLIIKSIPMSLSKPNQESGMHLVFHLCYTIHPTHYCVHISCLSVHLSIHPSIYYLSVHYPLSIHPPIVCLCTDICLSVYPPIIYPSIIYLCICYLSIICVSVYPSIYLLYINLLSTYLSIGNHIIMWLYVCMVEYHLFEILAAVIAILSFRISLYSL